MKKAKILTIKKFPRKKCGANELFGEKISHIRLEINTEGMTFSKVNFLRFASYASGDVAQL